MPTFIQFENRLIHLEAIASVEFSPAPNPDSQTVLRVDWIDHHSTYFKGDRAELLWNLLKQHSSGAIETTTLLASLDSARMLDCLGMHLAAVTIAAELLAAEADGNKEVILKRLLKQGKERYQHSSLEGLESALDLNLMLWESIGHD